VPPNTYVVDGTTYSTLASAYNACVANQSSTNSNTATCEIWDYYPQETATTPWPGSPWFFSGGETPVHLHLGPGVFITNGPFTVPRLSTISGSGRAGSTGAAKTYGTVIQSTNVSTFGGLILTATAAGVGCSAGTVTITNSSGSASFPGCSTQPSYSFALSNTLIYIGDSGNASGSTFGSRLENLTVDCNNAVSCSGIEIQNAQEQSGPRYVNVVNFSVYGIHVDGSGGNNSSLIDVEVDGCYSAASCLISSTTVPVLIENAAVRVDKITVNTPNTPGLSGTTQLASATCSGGTATLTAAGANTFPASFLTGAHIAVSGVTGGGTYNGTYSILTTSSSAVSYGSGCTGTGTISNSATANILPNAGIYLCGGPNCPDSNTSSNNGYASVVFTGTKHTERAGDGTFVTGQITYTDISPTCPSSKTLNNCIHLAGSPNQPSFYLIQNLLVAGGANVAIQDDGLSKTVTGTVIASYSGGSVA